MFIFLAENVYFEKDTSILQIAGLLQQFWTERLFSERRRRFFVKSKKRQSFFFGLNLKICLQGLPASLLKLA